MDGRTLGEAMGWALSLQQYEAYAPRFTEAMLAAGCNTPNRAAMWCAQIGHESVGLKYMEEIASGAAYEWRQDLGNVNAGDGVRFKGSGPIQLTGRANFRAFTSWARRRGLSNIDFEAHPELVRTDPKWGFLAATFYWDTHPIINTCADNGWIWDATRAINGGTNGINDRIQRWERCRGMGQRLLGGSGAEVKVDEKQLDYSRANVAQDTFYNCGPAASQTVILSKTGKLVQESELARKLGTTTNGTNWIGLFPKVLNEYMPDAGYAHVEMPQDPPSAAQKEKLWGDIVNSINGGFGVVANIVAPPSNYPRAVAPSDISPAYRGGTVYHYIAVMGYSTDGGRRCWIADSGFSPFGYWISFEQLASLIPPKGYAYATKKSKKEEHDMALLTGESAAALNDAKIAAQAAQRAAEAANRNAVLILDQLVGWEKDSKGPKFTGWKDLGNKTVVEALAEVLKEVKSINEKAGA